VPNKGKSSYGKSKNVRGVVHFTDQFEGGAVIDKRKRQAARDCSRCGKRLTNPKLIHIGMCRNCSTDEGKSA
jgi:hypothetical protein